MEACKHCLQMDGSHLGGCPVGMIEKAADPLASELASLRAKLAEWEKILSELFAVWGGGPAAGMSVSDLPGIISSYREAMIAECVAHRAEQARLSHRLAEWEAAGRKMAKLHATYRELNNEQPVRDRDTLLDEWGNAQEAVALDPLASRLVAEAGGTNG